MALKEQDIVFTTTDEAGNTVIQMPITRLDNVEGALKTVNDLTPDANGNVTIAFDAGVTSINGSAGDVTLKDYVTGLSVSGKTITYTKKDGTSGTITTQDTVYTHPNSGVTAGTYNNVTVNAQGHVTAGEIVIVVKTVDGYAPDATGNVDTQRLPLSGGTMLSRSRIAFADGGFIDKYVSEDGNTRLVEIGGGSTWNTGAILRLNDNDAPYDTGAFGLSTGNSITLRGDPQGNLTWNGVGVLNPVGTVIAFAANSAPSGYLLCNGAAVSRTTYASLFATIGTTYGAGDGSTTFNLPNLTDRFIQGSGTAGTVKSAGLPNIYGTFASIDVDATDAFLSIGKRGYVNQGSGVNTYTKEFSASRSSSIYGSSNTVQPPALTMRYYIKY